MPRALESPAGSAALGTPGSGAEDVLPGSKLSMLFAGQPALTSGTRSLQL